MEQQQAEQKDPKELYGVVTALVNGIRKTVVNGNPAVIEHLKQYLTDHKNHLGTSLPKWKDAVMKDLGSSMNDSGKEALKTFLKDSSFDVFTEKNVDELVHMSKYFGRTLENGVSFKDGVTLDKFRAGLAAGIKTSDGKHVMPMIDNLAKTYFKRIKSNAAAHTHTEDAGQNEHKQTTTAEQQRGEQKHTTTTTTGNTPSEQWQVELDANKAEAAALLAKAERAIKRIDEYAGTIPGKPQGAEEIIKLLNLKGDQAVEARDKLKALGKDDLANGVDHIYRTSVVPSIETVTQKQTDIKNIREGLNDELEAIKELKQKIDSINERGKTAEIDDNLKRMATQLATITDGQENAGKVLADAANVAGECIGRLNNNNEFSYYFVNHRGQFEESMQKFGGKYGLLNQTFGGGPDGATSAFESGLKTVYNGVASVGDWWHDVKMNASTQKERNMLNLAEQVAYGFGGLLTINAVNSMFFGGEMPAAVKWTAIIGLVGYLLHRSGETGQEMVDGAYSRMDAYSQNSMRHVPNRLPRRSSSNDNGRRGSASDNNDTSNSNRTYAVSQDNVPVIKDRDGNIVTNIVYAYPSGRVTMQKVDGGVPRTLPAGVIKLPVKGMALSVSAEMKEAIRDKVEAHIRDELVGKNLDELSSKMQGGGSNLPDEFTGNITIKKVNGVDLGQDAINVHYVVGKGVVEDMVRKEQKEALDSSTTMQQAS